MTARVFTESKNCAYCQSIFYKADFPKVFVRMITCGKPECINLHRKVMAFDKQCVDCGAPICRAATRCKICSSLGKNNPFYGKTHSEEALKRIKLFKKGCPSNKKGVPLDYGHRVRVSISKQKVHFTEWKGFKTPKNQRMRAKPEYVAWRKAVFVKNAYSCQECGDGPGMGHSLSLVAHHIKSWATFPELRFDINNGITYCWRCHETIHGRKIGHNRFQEVVQRAKDAQKAVGLV